jgi:hypothetical protein
MARLKQIESFVAVATQAAASRPLPLWPRAWRPPSSAAGIDALEERLGVKLLAAHHAPHHPHARGQRLPRGLPAPPGRCWPAPRPACQRRRRDRPAATCASRRRPASGAATWPPWCRGSAWPSTPRSASAPEPDRPRRSTSPPRATTAPCAWATCPTPALVSVRLADNRRLCVATPEYLRAPRRRRSTPAELMRVTSCLAPQSVRCASQTRGWAFQRAPRGRGWPSVQLPASPSGPLDCTRRPGAAPLVPGRACGIAWRSTWEVERRHRQPAA